MYSVCDYVVLTFVERFDILRRQWLKVPFLSRGLKRKPDETITQGTITVCCVQSKDETRSETTDTNRHNKENRSMVGILYFDNKMSIMSTP